MHTVVTFQDFGDAESVLEGNKAKQTRMQLLYKEMSFMLKSHFSKARKDFWKQYSDILKIVGMWFWTKIYSKKKLNTN